MWTGSSVAHGLSVNMELLMGQQGEFSSSSEIGLEKTRKPKPTRKISCAIQGKGIINKLNLVLNF